MAKMVQVTPMVVGGVGRRVERWVGGRTEDVGFRRQEEWLDAAADPTCNTLGILGKAGSFAGALSADK